MPVWPQEGSMKKVGPHYLLKLGAKPDVAHLLP
jgi:hypothetical protein